MAKTFSTLADACTELRKLPKPEKPSRKKANPGIATLSSRTVTQALRALLKRR